MQVIKLNYYIPRKEDIISYTSGIRPYREGGIRLQKQKIDQKNIFHNYGHGGGGLSLAYGCCTQLINNEFKGLNIPKNQPIAVLGAGIIGLTSALLLMELGYHVNIYADNFPFDKNPYQSQLTSTVAAGYWMPLKVGNKAQTKNIATITWNHYKSVFEKQKQLGQQLGIVEIQSYIVDFEEGYMQIQGIIKSKDCLIDFGNGKLINAKTFKTYIIQTKFYLNYLINLLKKSKKVQFIRTRINNYDQVKKLHQNTIFNCFGFQSYQVFIDEQKMKGIKGHIIRFKYQKSVQNYLLFLKISQDNYILQIPHQQSNYLNLGITFEENKINPFPQMQQVQKIFNNSKNYFQNIEKQRIRSKL